MEQGIQELWWKEAVLCNSISSPRVRREQTLQRVCSSLMESYHSQKIRSPILTARSRPTCLRNSL